MRTLRTDIGAHLRARRLDLSQRYTVACQTGADGYTLRSLRMQFEQVTRELEGVAS